MVEAELGHGLWRMISSVKRGRGIFICDSQFLAVDSKNDQASIAILSLGPRPMLSFFILVLLEVVCSDDKERWKRRAELHTAWWEVESKRLERGDGGWLVGHDVKDEKDLVRKVLVFLFSRGWLLNKVELSLGSGALQFSNSISNFIISKSGQLDLTLEGRNNMLQRSLLSCLGQAQPVLSASRQHLPPTYIFKAPSGLPSHTQCRTRSGWAEKWKGSKGDKPNKRNIPPARRPKMDSDSDFYGMNTATPLPIHLPSSP